MLWVAVSTDQYELPFAVAESGRELARMMDIKMDNVYKMKNASGKICGYRIVTVDASEERIMKYHILESFYDYLNETMKKNTARKYYSSVKSVLREAAFDSLDEVDPEFIKEKMLQIQTKNEFSAAKMGLLKLQEFDPALQLPEEQFFKEQARKKHNRVKSQGQKIYKDTIMRKINKVEDPDLRLAYRLGTVSGLRISEIADLKPEDIDLADGQIQIYVRNGKGGKTGTVTCLKDEYVAAMLKQMLERKKTDTTLFYSAGHMMNEANRLGFECHDLRRIFAQDLEFEAIQQGKSKKEAGEAVRIALRHSNIKTTNIYLKGRQVIRGQPQKAKGRGS